MHKETKKGTIECPYVPATFRNLNNIQTRLIRKRCANKPQNDQDGQGEWYDIIGTSDVDNFHNPDNGRGYNKKVSSPELKRYFDELLSRMKTTAFAGTVTLVPTYHMRDIDCGTT